MNFDNNALTASQIAGQIGAHAFAGGVIASLNGAKFSHGFISAGIAKGIGTHFNDQLGNQVIAGTLASAIIGGTTSSIVGGKFANGAVTGAMQYLFNEVAHRYGRGPTRMCWTEQSGCTLDNAREAIRPVSVPFTNNPAEGRIEIGPFNDPIEHIVDRQSHTITNITIEGHTFHSGQVVHRLTVDTRLSFSLSQGFYRREGIFLVTTGTGLNHCVILCANSALVNNEAGKFLFNNTHIQAPRLMRQYLEN